MVPHSWLKEAMELVPLADNTRKLLFNSKERWKTILTANNQGLWERYLLRRYYFPTTFCHSADPLICDTLKWNMDSNWKSVA